MVESVEKQKANLLNEDLIFPTCVLKESALEHNSRWMQRLLDIYGAKLAPHGKTTMSPQLFKMQLDDGAWGITLATVSQVELARKYKIERILLANQLVGKQSINYIVSELKQDKNFDFYCLVDNVDNVLALAQAAAEANLDKPLQVFVEIGYEDGRTGCRTVEEAMRVAKAVSDSRYLSLRGVEGFEGLIKPTAQATQEERIAEFLETMVEALQKCYDNNLFASGSIYLSAGGSAFYDMVLERFSDKSLRDRCEIIVRSGCYLTHDSIMYADLFEKVRKRSQNVNALGEGLKPALEVWGYVLSRPEKGRAIVGMGKRDASYDDFPVAEKWYRFEGGSSSPKPLENHVVVQLDDQHCHLQIPDDSPLAVGDAVQFGISHPCLTFDKWRKILLVDDDYNITGHIDTYF